MTWMVGFRHIGILQCFLWIRKKFEGVLASHILYTICYTNVHPFLDYISNFIGRFFNCVSKTTIWVPKSHLQVTLTWTLLHFWRSCGVFQSEFSLWQPVGLSFIGLWSVYHNECALKYKFDVVSCFQMLEILPALQEILSGTTPFQCLGMGNGKSFHEKVHTVEMLGLMTGRMYRFSLESPLINLFV